MPVIINGTAGVNVASNTGVIVLYGSTSGTLTLQANATAGTNTITLPALTGTVLTNKTAGSILQVVTTTKSDTFTASLNATFTDVTDLSASITPSSSSNKILVLATVVLGSTTNGYWVAARLLRNSTAIFGGNTAGNRPSVFGSHISQSNDNDGRTVTTQGLDSPNTTSSVTYKIQVYGESTGTTVTVNRSGSDANNAYNGRYASTITLLEIAS